MAKADTVHIIAEGETIYSLSRRYGVSQEAIIERNSIINISEIRIGTKILIPNVDYPPSINGKKGIYKVKRGDTYYSIAKREGLSLETLLALNGRDENRLLRVGEELIIDNPRISVGGQTSGVSTGTRIIEKENNSAQKGAEESNQEWAQVPLWPVNGRKRILDGKLSGVSIETEPLSYVYAVSGGNVVWTGPYRGFGHVVLVDSMSHIYLYGGNEDLFVNVGQRVEAGSRIGRLGSSSTSEFSYGKPEMIFAVFRDGTPIPPSEAPRG